MRKAVICMLALIALLIMAGQVVPLLTAAAPTTFHEEGAYEEDFTSYASKGHVESAEWDIWAQGLRLDPIDGTFQVNPAMARDGSDNTVVTWRDYQNGDCDIYAQRLDTNGNRLWADDVRVNSDSGAAEQSSPAVAVDGSGNAFVVWNDHRSGDGIYAQKLDESGSKLWVADVRVNSNPQAVNRYAPSVAVDGSGNAVVLWEEAHGGDREIYAQKLGVDGNRLWASDVRVNSDSGTAWQRYPAATVDGSGSIIAVWHDERNGDWDVYAQKLDGSGNRLWTTDVRVNSDSGTAHQQYPTVAVDGSGNAVVVWEDDRNGDYDIYTQTLAGNGNRQWAADVRVNSDSGTADQNSPAVAVGESGSAVVWCDYFYGNCDIYAQRLDTNGNRLWASEVRVNSDSRTASPRGPAVAVDSRGNTSIAWEDDRNSNLDVYAQRLGTNGNRLWAVDVRVNSDSGAAVQWAPAVAADGGGNAFVVWSDDRSGDRGIYAQKLDGSGNRLWATDVRVNPDSRTANLYTPPAVAVDGSGNAFVVWYGYDRLDGGYNIHAQKLDASGNRLWATDVRVNSDSGSAWQRYPAVAVDASGDAIAVWEDDRNGNYDIYAQMLDESGSKLWATDVRVNSDRAPAYSLVPAVAMDENGGGVVVWSDQRNGVYDVYAQRLNRDGTRLWAADVRVNSESGTTDQWSPAVAMGGNGNAIVAWEEDSYDDIYAQKLDASGNRIWATDVLVNSDSGIGSQEHPDMAVDGDGNTVVVWYDNLYGGCDIYAQKLDVGGNRLWAADVHVNSDSRTARWRGPAVAMDRGGSAFIVWLDHRNSEDDVYAQRVNAVGGKAWLADLQVVYPDQFYFPTGTAQSRTVDTIADDIAQATLTADYQTNGGEVQFYLTNNGGAHWAQVTPGVTHVFTTTGSDLRWRAVLTADPVWLRTPIVNSLRVEYSSQNPYADDYEPDDTCAQASPLQVNGAVQAHTFHQPDDEDWAWFNPTAGTTYVLQTAHAGPNADTVLELDDICDHPVMTDTNVFGHDARLIFTAPSDATLYARVTNQDGSVYGEATDYDLSVRTYHPNGLAVVVAGHNDAWQLQSNIDYAADQAYLTLLEAGFPRANVRYLGPDPDRDVDGNGLNDDIAATATITNVRYAVQDWPREQGLALGVPFYVYLMDHGHYDQFLSNGSAEKVTAPLLNLWLSNLEATTGADQITVVIDACKSGSFIDITEPGPAEISGLNRVIVASTTSQANAYPSGRGALFSDVFWTALGDNQDVWSAYRAAKAAVDARGLMQTPWLDDNGDAVANGEDGDLARGRGLAGVFGGSEPVIDWLKVGEIGAGGTATVAAQVRGDFTMAEVYVEVFPPGYQEPETRPGETPEVEVPTTTLTLAESDAYKATLTGLTVSGTYRVVGYAVDDEGNWALPRWIVVEGQGGAYQKVYLPLVLR